MKTPHDDGALLDTLGLRGFQDLRRQAAASGDRHVITQRTRDSTHIRRPELLPYSAVDRIFAMIAGGLHITTPHHTKRKIAFWRKYVQHMYCRYVAKHTAERRFSIRFGSPEALSQSSTHSASKASAVWPSQDRESLQRLTQWCLIWTSSAKSACCFCCFFSSDWRELGDVGEDWDVVDVVAVDASRLAALAMALGFVQCSIQNCVWIAGEPRGGWHFVITPWKFLVCIGIISRQESVQYFCMMKRGNESFPYRVREIAILT